MLIFFIILSPAKPGVGILDGTQRISGPRFFAWGLRMVKKLPTAVMLSEAKHPGLKIEECQPRSSRSLLSLCSSKTLPQDDKSLNQCHAERKRSQRILPRGGISA